MLVQRQISLAGMAEFLKGRMMNCTWSVFGKIKFKRRYSRYENVKGKENMPGQSHIEKQAIPQNSLFGSLEIC